MFLNCCSVGYFYWTIGEHVCSTVVSCWFDWLTLHQEIDICRACAVWRHTTPPPHWPFRSLCSVCDSSLTLPPARTKGKHLLRDLEFWRLRAAGYHPKNFWDNYGQYWLLLFLEFTSSPPPSSSLVFATTMILGVFLTFQSCWRSTISSTF